VYRLKTVCTCNLPALSGLWTLNIFAYDIYLRCGTLTKHDREPLFGYGNTFDRGLPVGKTKEYTQSGNGRFLRTFHQKNSLGWWALRVHSPSPFTLFTITNKVSVYAPAERAGTLPLFHLYPACTLWVRPRSDIGRHLPVAKEGGKLTRSTVVTKKDWWHRLSRQYCISLCERI
jgi:hypothetical protein